MSATFLNPDELVELTGCKQRSRQILQLRKMGLAFWVNAAGNPVVSRSVIEGRKDPEPVKTWTPKWAN